MTTVERYPSTQLDVSSDVPSNERRTHSTFNTITKKIPPAVPSPPRQSDQRSPPRRSQVSSDHEHATTMSSQDIGQWLFTEAELSHTPSVIDGLQLADERSRRAKGVNFIIQAGILLKLPQLTLATASVFFHRYYMRRSMVTEKEGIHHYLPRSKSHTNMKSRSTEARSLTFVSVEQNIAATALFLATKTEENCRKTKEIVIAVAKVAQKNASLIIDEQSKEYWRWRDSILLYEELMLEVLTFDVVLHSPYNSLYTFLQKLQIEDNKPLRNAAWAFLNDSFLTTMCLLVPPKDIAIAAIYFSARYTQTKIRDGENGTTWWEQLGGKPDMIARAVGVINEFYSENPLKRSENPYGQSPTSPANEEELDRTRGTHEAFRGDTPASQEISRSQRTQNGHQHSDAGTPVVNGNTPAHENNVSATAEVVSSAVVDGSSDEPLKEAANDPATHEANENVNGISTLVPPPTETSEPTPKRKEMEAAEEPEAKRQKTDSPEEPKRLSLERIAGSPKDSTQDTKNSSHTAEKSTQDAEKSDESEEGELEE